jgi:hypothetical protein
MQQQGYGRSMDSADAVLQRLDRIRSLDRDGADARALLQELRALVDDAATYAAMEGGETCGVAVERLREALARDMIEM